MVVIPGSQALRGLDMTEADIQRKMIAAVEKLGCLVIKIIRANKSGIPDLLILVPGGKAVFVEVKKPGGKPSKLQEYYISQLRLLGFTAFWSCSVDDVVTAVSKSLPDPKIQQKQTKSLL